ncbi:MAG: bifunctional 4-hydroxy-3-methylbut-2-enyl diphosphate reductase/30S ribosomal protein S1 [Christensenellales bacterium]|jgi:(E)-4-hydroxy-3-methyl-but-2-enyl pyrophosphate reductase
MIINVAKHCGFCFGVRRAMDKVEELLQSNEKVYTLGELIHNRDVVQDLVNRGAVAVNDVSEIPEGAHVVIRSHGVPPHILEECEKRGLIIHDATCPFVSRIHKIVENEAKDGKAILIVGDEKHPEVIGIRARAGEHAYVLSNENDVAKLPHIAKAAVVAQTTISKAQFSEVILALRKKIQNIDIHDTICTTTEERQREAEELARKSDAVVVIGGKHSSNTQKLAAICAKHCNNIYCVENPKAFASILAKLKAHGIISVVAGASTPKCMILEVLTSMSELENTAIQAAEAAAAEVAQPVEPEAAQASEVDAAADEFTKAFEKTLVRIQNGQVLTGTIVQITDSEVCVNIGYKSDGFIPRSEFTADADGDLADKYKVGDEIEVEIVKVNDGEGNVLLSHKSVESKKAWEKFIQAAEGESAVYDAICKEVVKGGVIASINGVRAFVPASQVSTRYVEKLDEYVGKPMRLMIMEVDEKKKRVVASQKKVLLAEAETKKKELWNNLKAGERVMGTVRRLTDFGAFVDIGGVDGLIHVTEMAWGRVKHPADVVKIGDQIEVLILAVDPEKERVSLSYKQLQPKPWTTAAERYPVGSIVEGKVVRIVPFGAFVSLEPTIDGLIHISQVATTRIAKVEDELKVGDIIRAKVLDVNPEAKRISLSRREVLLEEMPPIEDIIMDDADALPAETEVEERVSIPPVESATTSLADLFPKLED